MTVSKQLIDEFGKVIKPKLRNGLDNYNTGQEKFFIKDIVNKLDNVVASSASQHLHVKAKNIHGYPQADFDTSIKTHPQVSDNIVEQLDSKTPEIADLLVIANVYERGSIVYRQAFFSQSKCIKDEKSDTNTGILIQRNISFSKPSQSSVSTMMPRTDRFTSPT